MSGNIFTVNSRKYDLSIRRSWEAQFLRRSNESIELVGRFAEEVDHPDLGRIEKGTASHEIFYFDRWYNYFIFQHPDESLRNYYFNICMPPKVGDSVVDYVDLDIDLILWPDGELVTLDIEEFEVNARKYHYPTQVQHKVLETLEELSVGMRNFCDKTSGFSSKIIANANYE